MRAGIRTCRQLDPESLASCQAKPSHANSHRHRGIQELAIGVHLTCSAWKTTAGESGRSSAHSTDTYAAHARLAAGVPFREVRGRASRNKTPDSRDERAPKPRTLMWRCLTRDMPTCATG